MNTYIKNVFCNFCLLWKDEHFAPIRTTMINFYLYEFSSKIIQQKRVVDSSNLAKKIMLKVCYLVGNSVFSLDFTKFNGTNDSSLTHGIKKCQFVLVWSISASTNFHQRTQLSINDKKRLLQISFIKIAWVEIDN